MKCNLTKLVRCILIVVMAVTCINIFVFIWSTKTEAGSVTDEEVPSVLQRFQVPNHHVITTLAPVRLNSTVTCPGLKMQERRKDGEFQHIPGGNLYVYSAFRNGQNVIIIALNDNFSPQQPLICQMWFRVTRDDPLVVASATKENLPEDHSRRYTAAYIHCNIPDQLVNATLHAVSVVMGEQCGVASNILYLPGPSKMTSQFTLCVTPLNYRYSRAYELVEMIEMNKLLGAEKVVFYNHSTGPNVDKVLEMYTQRGEVEVHPWHLPMKVDTWPPSGDPEIHYFAQLAALNDCLYRHRNRATYLVYQDIDEFIIPYKHNTWTDLLKDRENKNIDDEISVFQFKCVFFRKEWFKPAAGFEEEAERYKSVILSNTMRENEYLMYGTRSKYIVNPRLTSTVGVHHVWSSSKRVDDVSENDASLHHYRTWERPNDPQPRVEDLRVVHKFGTALVKKLKKIWFRLEGVPMDIDIRTYGDHV